MPPPTAAGLGRRRGVGLVEAGAWAQFAAISATSVAAIPLNALLQRRIGGKAVLRVD